MSDSLTCSFARAAGRRLRSGVGGLGFAGFLLLAAWAAQGQSNAPAPTNAPAPASTNAAQMALQVVDVETGAPIPEVKVRAWMRTSPTDQAGVCLIPLPKPESESFSYKITLSKDGYVGKYVIWSKAQGDKIGDIPTNFTAKLEKGVAIGGIVKNEKGEPVPGARVILSGPPSGDIGERTRSVVAPNYHVERTDAEGQWHFSEAPRDLESLLFRVLQPEFVPVVFACEGAVTGDETIKLLPKADFLTGKAAMTLGHGIELAGRVVDAAGQPVVDATVTRNHEWRNPAAELLTDTNGQFRIVNLKPGEMYVTVQAKGLAGQSQLLTLSNGMPELKVVMAPGKVLQGKVVDPAGKPIVGATVQMDRTEFGPIEFEWNTTTDGDGHFAWDSAPEGGHPYLFFASGYHPRTEPNLLADGQDRVITMRPALDGDKTMIDGRVTDLTSKLPLGEFTLYVKEYRGHAISHSQRTFTNSDGHYAMAVASASSAYIITVGATGHRVEASRMKDVGDGDVGLDFALQPDPAMSGRLYSLSGHFVLTDYTGKITWTNQQMAFSTVVPPPALTATDEEAQRVEMQQFLATPEGAAWQQLHRNYDVEVDSEGAFKIEEVPEGSYHLEASVREAQAEGGEPVAGLSIDMDVPGSAGKTNTSIDLGNIPLAPKKALHLGDQAPPFEVKTLDGEPLRLADFHGKYVLLDFWATWCGPCVAETPFLKATYKKFGGVDRFAMVSLSLDNSPAAPKDFAHKNEIKWVQGFLGDWAKSKVTPLYGVEGIPSIFLIGPDGKILAKELRGEGIKQAVATALGND